MLVVGKNCRYRFSATFLIYHVFDSLLVFAKF